MAGGDPPDGGDSRKATRPAVWPGFRNFPPTKAMAFTNIVPDAFPYLYDDEWKLGLQQLSSRLDAYVDTEVIHGEGKRFQRLDSFEAREITTRFGDTDPDDIDIEFRHLFVGFRDIAHIVDRREAMQLGSVGSPHSAILRNQLAAAGRDMDRTLINGIVGSVQSGKTGGTLIALPAAQEIGVQFVDSGTPANSGMTFAKALEISTRLGLAQVTGQDVENQSQGCLVITHRQLKNLLLEEKLTNANYGLQRLMSGEVVALFGMAVKVVAPDILPYVSATDVRTCVAFARRSVVFGVAESPQAWVDVLPGKRHDVQLRTEWGWGATRLEDEGVITIACDESP